MVSRTLGALNCRGLCTNNMSSARTSGAFEVESGFPPRPYHQCHGTISLPLLLRFSIQDTSQVRHVRPRIMKVVHVASSMSLIANVYGESDASGSLTFSDLLHVNRNVELEKVLFSITKYAPTGPKKRATRAAGQEDAPGSWPQAFPGSW